MVSPSASSLPPMRPEAPGAKAARACGILAILFAITCVGIPVAIILGIIALVQQAKAKRLAAEDPQTFRTPTASGLVLGIVGLALPVVLVPVAGIMAAIAVPAFVNYRGLAADKVISANLSHQMDQLTQAYQKGKETGLDQTGIHAALEQVLQTSQDKNPLDPKRPACRATITIVSTETGEEAEQQALGEASTDGEIVFVVAYPPDPSRPGFLAGAAKLKTPLDGSGTVSRFTTLE
jgi:Tfp pilus assembly protein PilE